ncbi:MAG: ATP-binding protein [Anaerolineae bacterium]|nr:ATP-binding protein [Anaerolineae bacterium]
MLPIKLDDITLGDLKSLVANRVGEGKTLEYKREYPDGSDDSVKKFLAGVSAMANTSGGDFLIGIDAQDGIPENVPGVPLGNTDQSKLRLNSWLRDGLEPRLPRCDIQTIPVSETGDYLIIVRVPQSWIAPHRVVYKGHDKFYGRNAAGKYPLDVSELRTAFTLSEQITDRIRDFRAQRIAAVAGDEAPLPLSDNGKSLLHLVPLSAFTNPHTVDTIALNQMLSSGQPPYLPTPNDSRGVTGLALEGLVIHDMQSRPTSDFYTLLFRTGILELVYAFQSAEQGKCIRSREYEWKLLATLPYYLAFLKHLEVNPSVFLFLSFVGVKGYRLGISERVAFHQDLDVTTELRKDVLLLPEVVLETLNLDHDGVVSLVRPLLDLIWNAFGHPRSYNFDPNGKWIENSRF